MGKKNFKSGFEDLFSDAMEGSIAEGVSKKIADRGKKSTANKKSFASNLESLFEEAITESTIENANAVKEGKSTIKNTPKSSKKSKRDQPALGIDSLIRQTVETSKFQTTSEPNG